MASESEKYLPRDLLIDVFCRMDAKSCLRCSSVCKTWHHIINSPSFVKFHLTYQKTSSNAKRYILYQDSKTCTLLTDCEPLFDNTKHARLYYSPELFERDIDKGYACQLTIHGFCDGLLCFSSTKHLDNAFYVNYSYRIGEYRMGHNLHLWNPLCRKAKKLPELKIIKEDDWCFMKNGVSFGYYNDDYKVIVISCVDCKHIVSVYSLNSNCWNIVDTDSYYEDKVYGIRQPTKFVDGIAYMITDPVSMIDPPLTICFDLRDESIRQFRCPEEFVAYGNDGYTIEAYGETIAALGCEEVSGYLAMWILSRDKFSSISLWEKKLVIKLQERSISIPVGFLSDDRYIVRPSDRNRFFFCDLESQDATEYRYQEYFQDYICKINCDCMESLLLLNEDKVDPLVVHKEIESSCNSMLFTLGTFREVHY